MTDSPLRIVHCLRAPVGGLFRHVCDLAEAQARQGHLVGLIADSTTGGKAAEARLADLSSMCRLGIERFAMSRIPGPGDLRTAFAVGNVARRWRPDVLHGHGAKGGAYARIAGTRLRRGSQSPIRAYTPHGGSLHFARTSPAGFVFLSMERYLARQTDVFLFESAFGRDAFAAKVGPPRGVVRVVHNGLAPSEFAPVRPGPGAADFVFVGELRALKGIDTLLEALRLLDPGPDGPTAVIVGSGSDRDALTAMAGDLGLSGRVSFPGAMPARDAFALGRCVVVPSRAESLPYVVLEAIAAQLPVVATHVGGIPEIFGDQAHRLVSPDDPPGLAGAMRAVITNVTETRSLTEALAADVGNRFSIDAMTGGVLNAYKAAMDTGLKVETFD